jgi:hypothetical protein
MNDLASLLIFLSSTNTVYSTFTESKFLDDEAVKLGAILCISVRDAVNFNFDKNGRLIGTSTDSIKSFRKRERK